jgi:hypothetical protein
MKMGDTIPSELSKILCPHRGEGIENTLLAIEKGLKKSPFLLEFDVQLYNGELHLGHPPKLNKEETLIDALKLYSNSASLPKIDIKVTDQNWNESLQILIDVINSHFNARCLVNISGEHLTSGQAMKAEQWLQDKENSNILLNIDIERYDTFSLNRINEHLISLKTKPFSISPKISSKYIKSIQIAHMLGIDNIHFWCDKNERFSIQYLIDLKNEIESENLNVLYDIDSGCIELS